MADPTKSSSRPIVHVVPGDDSAGLCPTLTVDGLAMHDRVQPYQEVLPLEGKEPEVIALFGVGLGYTAAGALLLAPNAKVIAWEPIQEMADIARRMLGDEWNLADRVVIETDLADFQARLLEAVTDARSLATIELAALAQRSPDLVAAFRQIVDEVIDADTLGALATTSSEGWANVGRAAQRMTSVPLFSSLAGTMAGRPAVVVTTAALATPELDLLRSLVPSALLVATPASAAMLRREGFIPELVVVRDDQPPAPDLLGALVLSTVAIAPDSHPGWWEVACSAQLVFGHTSTAWMFGEEDPSAIISFRFGAEIPLALTAIALGARPIALVVASGDREQRWNLLHSARRAERVMARCGALAGTSFVGLQALVATPRYGGPQLTDLARSKGRPLGAGELQRQLARARRAVGRIAREQRQFQRDEGQELLSLYLKMRAGGHPFTRAFMAESDHSSVPSTEMWVGRRETAFGLLDWMEEQLPPALVPTGGIITTEVADRGHDPVRVFVAAESTDDVAVRVLLWSIDRFTSRRVEVRHLRHEIPARLGARAAALPLSLQMLLVPSLCGHQGKAIVVDPTTVLLEDIGLLWDQPLGPHWGLVPAEGSHGLALIDCARAPWGAVDIFTRHERGEALAAALLKPGTSPGIGKLPVEWAERDRATLETAAVRFTCAPWMPWKRDLHPLTWMWEYQLLVAAQEGYLSRAMLEEAVARGDVRATLLPLAPAGRASGAAARAEARPALAVPAN